VEVRIGIKHSPRELSFETESTADEVRALIALADVKGRQYLVDTESIAYIELGGEGGRKVGFIS
jgi:hypothetical protein